MDAYKTYREIICIDLKSFYASVECALRGLDPFTTPLVVADEGRGGGSIILAVSPYLKTLGIPGRLRLFELPKIKNLIIAKPRMRTYLQYSSEIIRIYLNYVAPEDLHIYSVDEAFLDVTGYQNYYQKTTYELAQTILNDVLVQTKIPATAGIGDTLFLAKAALDIESKKVPSGIAEWRYQDVPEKLWPVTPLSKMWSIGHQMERRLNQLGLFKVGDIAQFNRDVLNRLFGILGDELYFHAHGIDASHIAKKKEDVRPMRSVGQGQTLFKDYDAKAIVTVLFEIIDDVTMRLRALGQEAKTLHLAIGYSKAFGGGFSRQITLPYASCDPKVLMATALKIMAAHLEDLPIRRVSIRLTGLQPFTLEEQLSLFDVKRSKAKEALFYQALDSVKHRFGTQSISRLTSYFESGTKKDRHHLIGGHHG